MLGENPATFHFTPTSASWMNQVETWFGILTRQAIRRGSFESIRALSAAIERFTREWNAGKTPFTWVKTADEILAKAVRKTQADSGARHWSSSRSGLLSATGTPFPSSPTSREGGP
jgi:hypothetical protein